MQIRHLPSGEYVEFAPGLSVESMILTELCSRVSAKGVGVGRTTNHVIADLDAAFRELFRDLKKQIR
jgi:hypothetical protein